MEVVRRELLVRHRDAGLLLEARYVLVSRSPRHLKLLFLLVVGDHCHILVINQLPLLLGTWAQDLTPHEVLRLVLYVVDPTALGISEDQLVLNDLVRLHCRALCMLDAIAVLQ